MRSLLIATFLLFNIIPGFCTDPDEGMWIPTQVKSLLMGDMSKMGLNLTADQIYSINESSLKDGVVRFGSGFCTGEIVSEQGLVFTNHHCGFDVVQNHSSVEHDYLSTGFWAADFKDELVNPDLSVSILVSLHNVTEQLKAANDTVSDPSESIKNQALAKAQLIDSFSQEGKYESEIVDFYAGNEQYLMVYQTFSDVRLVGVPPSSIGKYGGDTDNWMWTRHTGDFCIFRIYTDKDGNPAEYSEDNIPYSPKHYFPISLKGVDQDDFTMVMGFPGSTDRYLRSQGVNSAVEVSNPARVQIRDKRLKIMKAKMDTDEATKIQYASTYAQVSNYWKYFIGQTKGLKALDVVGKKEKEEELFLKWIETDAEADSLYGDALDLISKGEQILEATAMSNVCINEVCFGIGINEFGYSFTELLGFKDELPEEVKKALKENIKEHFTNTNPDIEKQLLADLLPFYKELVPEKQLPTLIQEIEDKYKGDYQKYANKVFKKSFLGSEEKALAFVDKFSSKKLVKDMGFMTVYKLLYFYQKVVQPARMQATQLKEQGQQLFIAALREMNPQENYYPDANSTLRFSYGTVQPYYPRDAVFYDFLTTADGILEKEDATNEEFFVSPKLKKLILDKDFGDYGIDGVLPVNFISTNDITGGNSGSPVINGDGELIGIAFDGNWEAMSGDIAFETELQRCINVDIRYVLFVIDKYAEAHRLIQELDIRKN